jgi:prepilin-type processing-associated H-X9-DG protein
VPWVYSYASDDGRWQWSNERIDPISGEVVKVEMEKNDASQDAAKPNDPSSQETPAGVSTDKDAPNAETPKPESVGASETGPAQSDPEQKADKNGMLPHSRLGGNTATPLAVGGFSSSHTGGVNFAFGDGSVRFISDDASPGLLGRLANRADGQFIDAKEWQP